ncbi:MAG: PilZ domain-containing protein [Candidatus Moduliflexus flocculans]|nr:PilZ domain-containing protein [Candidatus Moduliflexus flocculans]
MEGTVKIVPVKEVSNDLPPLHIKSRNISKGGICLETKAIEVEGINLLSGLPFARKHRLHMNIELIPNEQLFEAIGEVRWYDISHDIPEYIYRVGVAFIDIKNNGKEQLLRFLKTIKARNIFTNYLVSPTKSTIALLKLK